MFKLTNINGQTIVVNIDTVLYIEPVEVYTRLNFFDNVSLIVVESVEEIYKMMFPEESDA